MELWRTVLNEPMHLKNAKPKHARIQKIFSGVGGPNSQKGSDGKFQHGKN